ncbi:MAG: hypothetical protein AB7U73_00760 [Pirellulales bacterium]
MDRGAFRHPLAGWLGLAVMMVPLFAGGCASVLATAIYVIKGNRIPAEYNGLREKRVVVVCRTPAAMQFSSTNVTRELATELSRRLQLNVSKIEVVDARDVDRWMDENEWDDPREVGKALDAQMIVDIDIDHFSLYQGQTLYQGEAVYTIEVIDRDNEGEVVFKKQPPRLLWPPNYAIPTQEKREPEFRREFVGVLAEEIGRYFYPHDAHADIAPHNPGI